jgi:hypothetical protein
LPRRAGSDLLPTDMDDVVAARWLYATCGREALSGRFRLSDYNLPWLLRIGFRVG